MFHSGGCFLRAFIPILAMFLAVGSTHAGIVASFQADYVAGTTAGQTRAERSADGWNYMSNTGGAIGTAANYTSLVWNPNTDVITSGGGYTLNSSSYPYNSNYVGILSGGTGHPGPGTLNSGSEGISRYAIAAYTIQSGEAGTLTLNNGSISTTATYPEDLRIYVNNTLINSYTVSKSSTTNFSNALGNLNVGDTVYVAVGAGTDHIYGKFQLDYQIASVPEPGTLVLFTVGTITCALGALRKKRRKTA